MAATAHGSAHVTADLDVVYARSPDNIARLAQALAPLAPYLRRAPPGLTVPLYVWRAPGPPVPLRCRHDPERAELHAHDGRGRSRRPRRGDGRGNVRSTAAAYGDPFCAGA